MRGLRIKIRLEVFRIDFRIEDQIVSLRGFNFTTKFIIRRMALMMFILNLLMYRVNQANYLMFIIIAITN